MKRRTTPPGDKLRVERSATLPDGRHLEPGTEFTIHGGGRYRFRHVTSSDGSICAWGPITSMRAGTRSFRPDKIKTVHLNRT